MVVHANQPSTTDGFRYNSSSAHEVLGPQISGDEGWHQDEWSVLTLVLLISKSEDLVGGELELDRGDGPILSGDISAGDLLVFRSWDAHRSVPVTRGNRHVVVVELWQGNLNTADGTVGRPVDLEPATGTAANLFCGPALRADHSSAALLWFCSDAFGNTGTEIGPELLHDAAATVGRSAYLWELAAAATALQVLDELAAGSESPSLGSLITQLTAAARLRQAALIPDPTAVLPDGWDASEDGQWQPPLIDGGDAKGAGGFWQKLSRSRPCGFPPKGVAVIRRWMARHSIDDHALLRAVITHPYLRAGLKRETHLDSVSE